MIATANNTEYFQTQDGIYRPSQSVPNGIILDTEHLLIIRHNTTQWGQSTFIHNLLLSKPKSKVWPHPIHRNDWWETKRAVKSETKPHPPKLFEIWLGLTRHSHHKLLGNPIPKANPEYWTSIQWILEHISNPLHKKRIWEQLQRELLQWEARLEHRIHNEAQAWQNIYPYWKRLAEQIPQYHPRPSTIAAWL